MFNNIKENIKRIIFIAIGIIPFGWGAVVAFTNYINYYHFKVIFLVLILFYVWIFLIILRIKSFKAFSEITAIAFLFLATLLIRYVWMLFLNVQPSSDFLTVFQLASKYMNGPFQNIYSARNLHWGFYSISIGELFKIFGNSLNTIKASNLVIAGLTSVGIYFLGKKISGSRRFGFLATLIYALWPADIFYKNLPTGEHIFSMLLPYVIILFIYTLDHRTGNLRKIAFLSILLGSLLGLMDLYKPISIVLIIAFGIAIIFWAPSMKKEANPKKDKILIKKLILFIFLVLAYLISKEFYYSIIKNKTGFQPNRNFYVWSLRIGMDFQYEGKWNEGISNYMIDLYDANPNNDKLVNKILLNETKEIIASNKSQLFGFMVNKFNNVWKSDYDFSYWASLKQVDNGLTAYDPAKLMTYLLPFSDSYLIFMLLFSFIGTLYCAVTQRSVPLITIGLFIIGFTILLFFSEVQQRYRSVLVSSIPFFATYGIYAINRIFFNFQIRIEKKK